MCSSARAPELSVYGMCHDPQVTPEMDLPPMAAGEWDQLLGELAVSPIKHVSRLEPILRLVGTQLIV